MAPKKRHQRSPDVSSSAEQHASDSSDTDNSASSVEEPAPGHVRGLPQLPARPRRSTAGVPAKRLDEQLEEDQTRVPARKPSAPTQRAKAAKAQGSPPQRKVPRTVKLSAEDKLRFAAAAKDVRNEQTAKNYKTHEKKFEWWCKFDPKTGKRRAQPMSTKLSGDDAPQKAALFMEWEGEGCPGYKCRNKAEKLGHSAFAQAHSMLQNKYALDNLQREDVTGVMADLKQHHVYRVVYNIIKAATRGKKGERPTGDADPHDNTIEDTMSPDQLLQLAAVLLASDEPEIARDVAMILWMTVTAGRGDDARLMFLPDMMEPRLMKGIGPALCFLFYFVEKGGKTLKNGRVGYTGCIRHRLAELCAIGALARWLVARFNSGEPFPDPGDGATWQLLLEQDEQLNSAADGSPSSHGNGQLLLGEPSTPRAASAVQQQELQVMTTGRRHQRPWFTATDGFGEQLAAQQAHEQRELQQHWQQQQQHSHATMLWQQSFLQAPQQLLLGQARQLPTLPLMHHAPSVQPAVHHGPQPFGHLLPHTLAHPANASFFAPVPNVQEPPEGLQLPQSELMKQLAAHMVAEMAQQGLVVAGAGAVAVQPEQRMQACAAPAAALTSSNGAVPTLNALRSIAGVRKWYAEFRLPCGETAAAMEERQDSSWRQGSRNRKRWSDIKILLDALDQRVCEAGGRGHSRVSHLAAAEAMDAERLRLKMSVNQHFNHHFVNRQPRAKKPKQQEQQGMDSDSEAAAAPAIAAAAAAPATAASSSEHDEAGAASSSDDAADPHSAVAPKAAVHRGAMPAAEQRGRARNPASRRASAAAPQQRSLMPAARQPLPHARAGGRQPARAHVQRLQRGPPRGNGGYGVPVLLTEQAAPQPMVDDGDDAADFDMEEDLREMRRRC